MTFGEAGAGMVGGMNSIETAAKAAHEANRVYCEAIGDNSQVAWEDAPEWQRSSCRLGVDFVKSNPDASPAAQHECWLEEKRKAGWAYGPEKCVEKKTHPCFVPYSELPPAQQAKDAIGVGLAQEELLVIPRFMNQF